MYHICPAQCQIQLARGEEIYSRDPLGRLAEAPLEDALELARPVGRAVARMNQGDDIAAPDRRLDLGRARDDQSSLVDDRQELQRIALDDRVELLGEIRR